LKSSPIALLEDGTLGRGGIRRYQRELVRALAERRGGDLDWVLYSADPRAQRRDTGGIPVRILAAPRWLPWQRWIAPAVRSALAAGARGIHLLTQAPLPDAPGLIITVHDLAPLELPAVGLRERARRLLFARRLVPSLRRAFRIVVDAPFVARSLMEDWGLRRERIEVVAPGLSGCFVGRLDRPRSPAAPPYVLAVLGRRERRKGEELLLRLWTSTEAPEADLCIVGARRGDRRPERVRYLGEIDDRILSDLYTGAAAVVCPSLTEGFGLRALEAMGHGAPVVASAIPAFEELVADAGILVRAGDLSGFGAALHRLLADPELALRLGERGRHRARAFTWERAVDRLVELYRRLP